jgi:uncharacterized protein (TIGR03083 family)
MTDETERALAALAREVEALDALLAPLPAAAWERPTRLSGWDVTTLVAHLARGVARIAEYGAAPLSEPAQKDRLSYWRYDPAALAAGVTARALKAARGQTPASLRAELRQAVADAQATARRLGPTTVVASAIGPIALGEYLPTRLLEVCVHGLDLRQAIGAPPTPTPDILASTVATLEGLLGGPRPADLADDVAFVEAATGRRAHADPRLPVLG